MRRRGDGISLQNHHVPQASREFTHYGSGGAISMTQAEHTQTRTYGGRGAQTRKEEAGLGLRDTLARDIRDVRSIKGDPGYNRGLRDVIEHYRSNFPDLMRK